MEDSDVGIEHSEEYFARLAHKQLIALLTYRVREVSSRPGVIETIAEHIGSTKERVCEILAGEGKLPTKEEATLLVRAFIQHEENVLKNYLIWNRGKLA